MSAISNAERLPIKTYTVADGLLRDTAYKIKQDSRGFLWFCTQEGVSRFDGYAFTNFTVNDGLPDRRVNDFLETKDGTIYIATDGGLARLNPTGNRLPFDESKEIENRKSKIENHSSPFIFPTTNALKKSPFCLKTTAGAFSSARATGFTN